MRRPKPTTASASGWPLCVMALVAAVAATAGAAANEPATAVTTSGFTSASPATAAAAAGPEPAALMATGAGTRHARATTRRRSSTTPPSSTVPVEPETSTAPSAPGADLMASTDNKPLFEDGTEGGPRDRGGADMSDDDEDYDQAEVERERARRRKNNRKRAKEAAVNRSHAAASSGQLSGSSTGDHLHTSNQLDSAQQVTTPVAGSGALAGFHTPPPPGSTGTSEQPNSEQQSQPTLDARSPGLGKRITGLLTGNPGGEPPRPGPQTRGQVASTSLSGSPTSTTAATVGTVTQPPSSNVTGSRVKPISVLRGPRPVATFLGPSNASLFEPGAEKLQPLGPVEPDSLDWAKMVKVVVVPPLEVAGTSGGASAPYGNGSSPTEHGDLARTYLLNSSALTDHPVSDWSAEVPALLERDFDRLVSKWSRLMPTDQLLFKLATMTRARPSPEHHHQINATSLPVPGRQLAGVPTTTAPSLAGRPGVSESSNVLGDSAAVTNSTGSTSNSSSVSPPPPTSIVPVAPTVGPTLSTAAVAGSGSRQPWELVADLSQEQARVERNVSELAGSLRHFIIVCSVAVVLATSLAVALILLLLK